MKKFSIVILIVICLCLVNSLTSFADCPRSDLTGDCEVELSDFVIMASEWLVEVSPEEVIFGKLVIERDRNSVIEPDLFVNLLKDWLEGFGNTTDAVLIYMNTMYEPVREVHFYGLRPTLYYTLSDPSDSAVIEHIEFSIEHLDIVNCAGDIAYSSNFYFEIHGGLALDVIYVKPPEIYFDHVPSPQSIDYIPLIAGSALPIYVDIDSIGTDNWWEEVSGADIVMNYFEGNILEAKIEDVALSGRMVGYRDGLLDWINSWIDDFYSALPKDITIEYDKPDGPFGGRFLDCMPTSFDLPSVDSNGAGFLEERLTFRCNTVTDE